MYLLLPGWKILISLKWQRVFWRKLENVDKIFIQNLFSALSLKYKVSVHNQITISQYTNNLQTKFHMKKIGPFLLFNFLTWCKVITSTGNASVDDVFNLIMWLYLRMGCVVCVLASSVWVTELLPIFFIFQIALIGYKRLNSQLNASEEIKRSRYNKKDLHFPDYVLFINKIKISIQ